METDILVNGNRFKIIGFPSSSQDHEFMVCAETAIWETSQYFGSKYPEYRTAMPSEIISILAEHTHERDIPSHGLYSEQISYVLKKLGFEVRIYDRSTYQLDKPMYSDFYKILHYYVDSAIPMIGILKSKATNAYHAVLYIGYKYLDPTVIDSTLSLYSSLNIKVEINDFADFINEYVICDDNRLIYQYANFTLHGSNPYYKYLTYYSTEQMKDLELESIIVPLPRKVYLEASQAKKFIFAIIQRPIIGISITKETVLRVFFTTSRSFKSWVRENNDIDVSVKRIIIGTAMPRFIWIGELSTLVLLKDELANGFVIVDATQSDANPANSLLFVWNPESLCYYDDIGSFAIHKELKINNNFKMFQNFR